ncbi:MAG: TlpA family protein disulfide reductase [Saprospiraceae bacterium]|nr:TlpA family protein disulfide reductase [Saprospiraceae bacterium]
MKFRNYLATLCLLAFAGTISAQNALPNVDVKTLDGATVNLSETYGVEKETITILSFWATWCSPCKRELDAIMDFYPDWQESYNVELVAITIDTRRAISKVPSIVETKGWEYIILSGDEQAMRTAFNFASIPQTVIVDQSGQIVYTHNGYQPGDEEVLDEVLAKLAAGESIEH